jgi:hypothetical protein
LTSPLCAGCPQARRKDRTRIQHHGGRRPPSRPRPARRQIIRQFHPTSKLHESRVIGNNTGYMTRRETEEGGGFYYSGYAHNATSYIELDRL